MPTPRQRLLLWVAAFAVLIALRLPRIDAPLLDHNAFRQTQTALTAYWFRDGVQLPDYPLPIFGPPWSVPFEFPLFQLAVAAVATSGLPLDLAGRLCGLATFVAALLFSLKLLADTGAPSGVRIALVILAGLSPFALVWSRACLIEFTAVALGLLFALLAFQLPAAKRLIATCVLATGIGIFAAITKVTTFPVYLTPIGLLAFATLYREWHKPASERLHSRTAWILVWSSLLVLPLAAAAWWTHATDEVKSLSPLTQQFISTNMSWWNFGPLSQRFDGETWRTLASRVATLVAPWVWPLAFIGLFAIPKLPAAPRLLVAGLLIGSALTLLTFFNLYVVHEYYLCAIVFPIWMLVALAVGLITKLRKSPKWSLGCFSALAVILAATSVETQYVRLTYRDRTADELLTIGGSIRARTSSDSEIVVFGDGWNPRVFYYAKRKGLIAIEPAVTDAYALSYVTDHHVSNVVTTTHQRHENRVRRLWPNARVVTRTPSFLLFSVDTPHL